MRRQSLLGQVYSADLRRRTIPLLRLASLAKIADLRPMPSFVYVLIARNKSGRTRTYVGWTLDLDRRLAEHNGAGKAGAKSTRGQSLVAGLCRKIPHPAQSHGAGICLETRPRLPRRRCGRHDGRFSGKLRLGEAHDFRTDRDRRMPVLSSGLQRDPRRRPDRSQSQADRSLSGPGGARWAAHPLCAGHPHPCRSFLGGARNWAAP